MSRWDDLPDVRSSALRPLSEILAPGARRQEMTGFDPGYRDFVDYIMRCTHRIWEEKNVGLCRSHYSEDCAIHTLAGPVTGVEAVVQNTIATLSATPDRKLIGEDVIWSADPDGIFYSSHRIMSRSTHFGDDALLGEATLHPAGVITIADCACRENRIVEEWLVRDNLRAVWQVGGDPLVLARAQAESDREGDQSRHQWRADALARTRGEPDCPVPAGHPAAAPAAMLATAFREAMFGDAARLLAPTAELRWPSNRVGYGRGFWIGCVTQIAAALHGLSWRLEHIAARPLPAGEIAVALRWSLAGVHRGGGVWGTPGGRDIYLLAVSHYRMKDGAIVEDATVFDELAVLRQVEGGLGA